MKISDIEIEETITHKVVETKEQLEKQKARIENSLANVNAKLDLLK